MEIHSLGRAVFLFTLLSKVYLVSSTCYNPDGTAKTSPAYQPCVQTVGTFSQCCGTNWTANNPLIENDECMPNGLCLNNNPADNQPLYWRGSCTDPTWKSPFCLSNLCTNSSDGGNASDNVPLRQCTDGSWCCGSTNTTCCNEGLGVKLDAVIGVANASSSTSSSSIASSTSTSTSSSTATNLATSATGSPSSSPTKSAQDTQLGMSTGAKAGVGIAVAVLFVAAVAGITWFFLRQKSNGTVVQQWPTRGPSGNFVYGTPQELPESGKTVYAEMGSKHPERFQHEVAGYAPLPAAELASSRYRY
ncbi:hypothetical protein L207DRAFT_634762 [Hyaloscypha variabilis F]|uniref:Mid2 domain-containing protein n=1 Tax=Hyaloscypha variabilis (strain UAMH 11265 / GT02V1 / F) TaxID=1149755 RepID=A0A2J6RJS2_HYAVF|nr:hypothetical protein L207DRAFT_634762 [Hyaloscypha variabilis F]